MADKVKTLYRSIYECDYVWPTIYKKPLPVVSFPTFPEHCKDLSAQPCGCAAQFCICRQKRYTRDDPRPEILSEETDPEAFTYLKGVKSIYQDDFSPEGPKEDQSILPTDLCPKPKTPSTRIWNPYLVPRDAFRPGQSRPLGCRLTFESVTKPIDYQRIKRPKEVSMSEVEELFRFPCTLQEKIALQNMKAQKVGICRERPAARKRIF